MSVIVRTAFLSLFCILFSAAANQAIAATSEEKNKQLPLTLEEINKKRREAREELMLPSLNGVRGISYRVVGYKEFESLEKLMGAKLETLRIPCTPYLKTESMKMPCDAIVQISFFRTGNTSNAELKVTQWVSLVRNPKINVKAVTYSNKVYLIGNKPEQAIEELTNEFVVDFLKANQKDFAVDKYTGPAQSKSKK